MLALLKDKLPLIHLLQWQGHLDKVKKQTQLSSAAWCNGQDFARCALTQEISSLIAQVIVVA
ncbi:MAG TPA: hypothetical protein DCF96_06950 [Rhodobacteraceae bacterium]|nr:hypothetical protein [Paracoccaceae bacterium]